MNWKFGLGAITVITPIVERLVVLWGANMVLIDWVFTFFIVIIGFVLMRLGYKEDTKKKREDKRRKLKEEKQFRPDIGFMLVANSFQPITKPPVKHSTDLEIHNSDSSSPALNVKIVIRKDGKITERIESNEPFEISPLNKLRFNCEKLFLEVGIYKLEVFYSSKNENRYCTRITAEHLIDDVWEHWALNPETAEIWLKKNYRGKKWQNLQE